MKSENNLRCHLIAFLVAAGLMTALCLVLKITPLGDQTFLYDDLRREFIEYYAFLKRALHGDASLLYSRDKGIGGSMFGLYINYMSSPINLIYGLFPVSAFPTVLTVLLILRMGLCAFNSDVFLSGLGLKKTVPFAVTFAMSMWVFVSLLNPLWLDAAVMFPLFCRAGYEFQKDPFSFPKCLIMAVATAFQFFLNYYTAVMMVIFMAIWTILRWLLKKTEFKAGLMTAFGLISGILLISPVIIPVFLELRLSEKTVGGSMLSNLFGNITLTDPVLVISKLFSFAIDGRQVMFGMPHLFAGTVILPLAVLFFISERIDLKNKIEGGALLLIIFISFIFSPLNLMWHAGNEPNGYPFRYAFLFVGVEIVCAAIAFEKNFDRDNPVQIKKLAIAFAVPAILELIVMIRSNTLEIAWLKANWAIAGEVILVALFILSYMYLYGEKGVKVVAVITLLLCAADLTANQIKIVRASYVPCLTLSEYQRKLTFKEESLAEIMKMAEGTRGSSDENTDESLVEFSKNSDQDQTGSSEKSDSNEVKLNGVSSDNHGFYRVEDIASDPYDSLNDSLVLGYHGVSHYSTGDHRTVRMFLKSIGFNYNGLYDQYTKENTDTADAILAIKYIMEEDGPVEKESVFPAAVAVNEDTVIPEEMTEDDPFAFQDAMARVFAGQQRGENIFKEARIISTETINLPESDTQEATEDAQNEEPQDDSANATQNEEPQDTSANATQNEKPEDDSTDDSQSAGPQNNLSNDADQTSEKQSLIMEVQTACDGNLYFYIKGLENTEQNMAVYVNDEFISGYANASAIKIIDLGYFEKNENITVKLETEGNPEDADFGEPLLFSEDLTVLSEYSRTADSGAVTIEETSPTKLTLKNISKDAKSLLLSIPMEEGFSAVTSDGRKLGVTMAFGALTKIDIPEDYEGDVILRYSLPGLETGLGLFGLGIILIGVCWITNAVFGHNPRKSHGASYAENIGDCL